MLRYIPLLGRLVPTNSKTCQVLSLPNELLSIIFSHLSLPSQACFALTCKPLLKTFGTVLKDEALTFPHINFDYHGRELFDPNARTRTELLLRLQADPWRGRQWRYCGECLKLHPTREFTAPAPMEYDPRPEEAACMYLGVVALCHCVHLSARGKIRLVEMLERRQVEQPPNWHDCRIYYPAGITVDVAIGLALTELGELVVRTRYVVRPGVIDGNLKPWRIMCCPHEDIFAYLRRGLAGRAGHDCCWCQTAVQVDCGDEQSSSSVQVTRYLGGKRYPVCRTWRNQREKRYRDVHR